MAVWAQGTEAVSWKTRRLTSTVYVPGKEIFTVMVFPPISTVPFTHVHPPATRL